MSPLFRNRWVLVLILWTGLIAFAIVLNLPGATRAFPPCDYGTDPSLPRCPPDAVNVDALWIIVLSVLWVGGVVAEGATFVVWRLWRWLARRDVSPPGPGSNQGGAKTTLGD
jgi:hypothetical protein